MSAQVAAPSPAWHPATVLVCAGAAWVLVVALNIPWVTAAILLLALTLGTVATRSLSVLVTTVGLAAPVSLSLVLVHAPYGVHRIFPLLTADGLALAAQLSLRFAALMAAMAAAAAVLPVSSVAKALQTSCLGHKAAYVAGVSLQSLPQGALALATVREANQLAGRQINLLNVVPRLIIPVIARLLYQGTQRGNALAAVGFDAPAKRTVLVPVPDSTTQRVLRRVIVLVVVLVLGVRWLCC